METYRADALPRMRIMFVANPDSEMTQVAFWNLYKDAFTPHVSQATLLPASEVIKNINVIFPQAQAMVLQDPVQRFVVRGVDRRKETTGSKTLKCQWDRSECTFNTFETASALYDHILEQHIPAASSKECLWLTCTHQPSSGSGLKSHVLTHLSRGPALQMPPSQSDTITLIERDAPYPLPDPTVREPPPAARGGTIVVRTPMIDPPSHALTALLCIRILFRVSFASADAAPRVSADRFGFPGVIEDMNDQVEPVSLAEVLESELEGERLGRKAFVGIRYALEGVRMKDEVLEGWIQEMIDASIGSSSLSML